MEKKYKVMILTTDQVAAMLQVHRSTICRLALAGEIKSHLMGRCRRFKESDVLEFFENQADWDCVAAKEN